ncbi:MAG: hypothetical protein ACO1N9_04170 [Flavobacterium sp.]
MRKYFTLTLFFITVVSIAQGKVVSGDFKNLVTVNTYNVVFDYAGMKVAHFNTEEEFLNEKMGKREGEKAENFRKKWFADREANYEPKFVAYFNKRMDGKGVTVSKNPDAPYTMQVKTIWLYPGYNVGVGLEEAKITAVITVFETANPANILLKVEYDKSPGLEPEEYAFDPGNRIAGAYEKLAKNFTMQLRRFVK